MKSKANQNRTKKGFTIIEVVMSLFIISVMLLVYNAAVNTLTLSTHSKNQEIALKIANNKLETLRRTQFASLPASGSFSDSLLSSLQNGQADLQMHNYNSKTMQAVVIVSWTEHGSSATHNVQLDTLITQGGLSGN